MENMHTASPLPSLAEIVEANPDWLDEGLTTKETSDFTGVPAPSLETLRSRGGGPEFLKVNRKVLYTRRACLEWMAGKVRTSTSDSGRVDDGLTEAMSSRTNYSKAKCETVPAAARAKAKPATV